MRPHIGASPGALTPSATDAAAIPAGSPSCRPTRDLQEVLPKVGVTTVVTTRIGDQLSFPKSLLINLAVKYLKKMVPRWRIPGTVVNDNWNFRVTTIIFAGFGPR